MINHFGLARQYQNLKDELLDVTDQVLKSGILMNGEFTHLFEKWLSHKTKTKYAITVHSGTQALEIIARYHKDLNNEVYEINIPSIKIPNISYIATLNAFINAGWEVELVDTDLDGLIKIREEEYKKLFSVCLVGLYGARPPNIGFNGWPSIVDGAQHWLVANYIGDAMAISFDPTKNLPSSGNGGAIVTNDKGLSEFAASYISNGKPEYSTYGTNSRMSELDCAHLLVRTKYIDEWQERRRQIRQYYLGQFRKLPFRCLSENHDVHADQKFVIYTDKRSYLLSHLREKNIEIKVHYERALSEHLIAKNLKKPDLLSNSIMLTRGLLSLPIYPELTDGEVEYIAKQVKDFFI